MFQVVKCKSLNAALAQGAANRSRDTIRSDRRKDRRPQPGTIRLSKVHGNLQVIHARPFCHGDVPTDERDGFKVDVQANEVLLVLREETLLEGDI